MSKGSKKKKKRAGPAIPQAPSSGKTADRAAPPPEREPIKWEPRHTWIVLGMILAASFIVGMAAVLQFRDSPFFNLPIIDEEAYVSWGREIASGSFWGETIFYQDPLYPYFLGVLFSIFGEGLFMVRLAQVALGTASIALVFWTGRRILGDRPALLCAGIMACYRGMYFFEILLLKATMVIFFSALSCSLGVWASERPKGVARFLAVGLSLGLLTLLRGNFQAILPLMVVWALFVFRDGWGERIRRAALLCAGILLVIVPVSLRNYAVGGELVLTTSQGGANFYIGNNERANGRYVTLPFVRANPKWESSDFQKEAEKRTGRELSPSEVSGFWFGEAFKWIGSNPGKAARLLVHKARLMVHQHEIPDNHSFYLTRDQFVPVLWIPLLGFGLLWGPALIGMWLMARRDPRSWYPAMFAVLYAGSIIPFFIVARYRLAVVPSMALFAAGFITWAADKWSTKDYRALAPAGAAIVASLLIGFIPTSVSRAPMGLEYYLLGNGYLKTDQPAKAIPWYDRAMETLPNNKDIVNNRAEAMRRLNTDEIEELLSRAGSRGIGGEELLEIGKRLEQLGQFKNAVQVYEAAAREPGTFLAHARLGYLYSTQPEVKDTERALFHLAKALEIRPGSLDTMNALGNVNFLAGNTVEARHWWEEIIKIDPEHRAAQQNLETLESNPLPPGPGPEGQ